MTALDSARTLLALFLQIGVSIALPWLIVRLDMSLVRPEFEQRCWPDTTLLASVVVFGPLCLPVHFLRTRRGPLGLCLGLVWMMASGLLSASFGLIAP